jgi:hypothetical protein
VRTKLSRRELFEKWKVPDTARGRLGAAEYHALSKDIPAQKQIRGNEKNGEYFASASFGGDGRRIDENVEVLSGFVLDFDSGKTGRRTIEAKLSDPAASHRGQGRVR